MLLKNKNRILRGILCFILSGTICCYAQLTSMEEATEKMKESVQTMEVGDSIIEFNTLPSNPNLVKFTATDSIIEVGLLVKNGDYSRYYKNNTDSTSGSRNTWVFYPDSLRVQFNRKTTDISWKRLSRFLDLEDTNPRDTVVILKAKLSDLYRPAYVSGISEDVPYSDEARCIVSTDNDIIVWFHKEQKNNHYPWTRMGYTYDWGDPNDIIGTSEFILKPHSYRTIEGPVTLQEFFTLP
ncbi:MAG: hypothetical protein LIO79_05460 [Rikenellaceae bacterium]|nr:hypothetical protein [Rikenellaceae bacterium]